MSFNPCPFDSYTGFENPSVPSYFTGLFKIGQTLLDALYAVLAWYDKPLKFYQELTKKLYQVSEILSGPKTSFLTSISENIRRFFGVLSLIFNWFWPVIWPIWPEIIPFCQISKKSGFSSTISKNRHQNLTDFQEAKVPTLFVIWIWKYVEKLLRSLKKQWNFLIQLRKNRIRFPDKTWYIRSPVISGQPCSLCVREFTSSQEFD